MKRFGLCVTACKSSIYIMFVSKYPFLCFKTHFAHAYAPIIFSNFALDFEVLPPKQPFLATKKHKIP